MRSYLSLLALAGAVAAVDPTNGYNVMIVPLQDQVVTVGEEFTIMWQFNPLFPGSSKLVLLAGSSPQTLSAVETLTESIDNSVGQFTWKVDGDPNVATFGFEFIAVDDSSLIQFSFPFHIDPASGGDGDSGHSATVTTSTTTTGTGTGTATSEASATVTVTSTTTTTPKTTTTTSTSTSNSDWVSISTTHVTATNSQFHQSQSASPTWSSDDCKPTGAGQNGTGNWPSGPDCDCGDDSGNGGGGNGGGGNGGNANNGWQSTTTAGPWGNGTTSNWQTAPSTTQTFVNVLPTSSNAAATTSIVLGAASKAGAGAFGMLGGVALAILAL